MLSECCAQPIMKPIAGLAAITAMPQIPVKVLRERFSAISDVHVRSMSARACCSTMRGARSP